MREEHLTTKLSTKSAQVLLALVLVARRDTQATFTQVEFAKTTGLPVAGWSIPGSLGDLEEHGLITIIHRAGRVAQVYMAHPQEDYLYEVTITEAGPDYIGSPAQPLLLGRGETDEPGLLAGASGIPGNAQATQGGEGSSGEDIPIHSKEIGRGTAEAPGPTNPLRARNETTTTEDDPAQVVRRDDLLLFAPPGTHRKSDIRDRQAIGEEGVSDGNGQVQSDPLEVCRLADENGSPATKREALRAVWDIAFPIDAYPLQRLTDSGASRLLAGGRRAEDVGRAILAAPDQATRKIEWPLGYVSRVVEGMERKAQMEQSAQEEAPTITDDLRKLTERMGKHFGYTTQAET